MKLILTKSWDGTYNRVWRIVWFKIENEMSVSSRYKVYEEVQLNASFDFMTRSHEI
jgi:hypothetical protein